MKTAVDSNVFVALWSEDGVLNRRAESFLDASAALGRLVICPAVYCELAASPGRDQEFVTRFLRDTSVEVDWDLDEPIWRVAAEAFRAYAIRRRKQSDPGPRRILADFLIGAHAVGRANRLLTLDARIYRASFPKLNLITF
jgi:hypothetical protein